MEILSATKKHIQQLTQYLFKGYNDFNGKQTDQSNCGKPSIVIWPNVNKLVL